MLGRAVSHVFPDFAALKSLLAGLNLPHAGSAAHGARESRSPSPEQRDPDDDDDAETMLELQRPSSPPLPAAQLLPFQKRISKGASLDGQYYVWQQGRSSGPIHTGRSTQHKQMGWDLLSSMGVFTLHPSNIKGFAFQFACASHPASCVN